MSRKHKGKRRLNRGTQSTNRKILFKYGTRLCFWCGCKLTDKTLRADHFIALSQGGSHKLANLVSSCDKCNSTRSDWQHASLSLTKSVPKLVDRDVEKRYIAIAEDRYISKLGCSFIDRHKVGRYIGRNTCLCR